MIDSPTSRDSTTPCDGITRIDDLAELRSTLEIWIDRASKAVWQFNKKEDGSFWTTSKVAMAADRSADEPHDGKAKRSAPHVTTTARSFVALLYAQRSRGDDVKPSVKEWGSAFRKFVGDFPMTWDGTNFIESNAEKTSKVNAFDVAHLADFFQVNEYLDRFDLAPPRAAAAANNDVEIQEPEGLVPAAAGEEQGIVEAAAGDPTMAEPAAAAGLSQGLRDAVVKRLTSAIAESTVSTDTSAPHLGEVRFDSRPESAHFFATLHALRGLHALGAPLPANIASVVEGARSFAIEQCYYYQRGATHRQDALRLAFAGSIYAIYGDHVDQDLCLAIIEALHQAQQDNGSWPATHPILRKKDRPWHIASHEVALCLTWLYFQPKVPDSSRPLLISMLRRYLLDAVAPTFFRAPSPSGSEKKLEGWQDDHTVGTETTVGWATAIICHFLANFSQVLDDWINRRVIEDLDLQLVTDGYIIDDVVGKPAPRWQRSLTGTTPRQRWVGDPMAEQEEGVPVRKGQMVGRDTLEVWPDLPPHAWSEMRVEASELARGIYSKWTDPTDGNAISKGIARLVLLPIFSSPDQRPAKDQYAGLLPGKPGTRKTSLVDRIASTVMWPKVAVPASLIFAKGFDMMEAQANAVFDRLNHLRRCVIFFDEFEEFFVKRQEDDEGDTSDKSRTIAAFTTSAMLPRLQKLHDVRRCLIFLATNNLKKIDSAIKRRGRFDFTIQVDHPSAKRLLEYLDNLPAKTLEHTKLDQLDKATSDNVIEAVKKALHGDKDNPEVRFAWIEHLLERFQNVEEGKREMEILYAYNKLTRVSEEAEDPPKIDKMSDEQK